MSNDETTPELDNLRKAAKQGDADAQIKLGSAYCYGVTGVPMDKAEAVRWFRKAAEQGHVFGQALLGAMYEEGEGVPINKEESVKWYRKAADQGDADAQYAVGIAYDKGEGVPVNKEESAKWYRKAAEQGNADAQYALSIVYAKGEGVPINNAEALKWLRKAAEQGNEAAQEMIAKLEEEAGNARTSTNTRKQAGFISSFLIGILRAFRIMLCNNYGLWPRKKDYVRYSHVNISRSLNPIRRFLLLLSCLWIIPMGYILFMLAPQLRFFFDEPPPISVELRKDISLVAREDIVCYDDFANIDGKKEKITLRKGTVVHPYFRQDTRVVLEDARGTRYSLSNAEAEESLAPANKNNPAKGYDNLPQVGFGSLGNIYTEQDIRDLLLGKSLAEVERRYGFSTLVKARADGSRIAQFGGISQKGESGRKDGLVLETDPRGIIIKHGFAGGAVKAGVLDYIPYVSKIMDIGAVRRFIRGVHSPGAAVIVTTLKSEPAKPVAPGAGEKQGNGFRDAIMGLPGGPVVFAMWFVAVFNILGPFVLVPFFVVLALMIPRRGGGNARIIKRAKLAGTLFFLLAALIIMITMYEGTAALVILPSLILCYFVFIPEFGRELRAMRCEKCGGWDTRVYNGNKREDDMVYVTTTTTKTRYSEDKSVSKTRNVTYEYECKDCGCIIPVGERENYHG